MKKFGFFAFFCGLCGTAWAAASIRASSIPLSGGTSINTPKVTVSTISTTPDSDATNLDINTSRIAFTSPLAKTNRYYVPNSNSGGTTSSTSTPNTKQEISELQRQIDELVQKQTQIENTLPTTVQTVVKTTDLTQNTSFNEAISDLQETVVSDSAIDSKISDKLVEKGIVDNRGNLLVATSEEIQPIALSQKLENTLAVKFAKKSDYTPSKIATNIANDTAAVTTLSNRIGTNENTVKNIIKSDLQNRGIVDNNNQLQVATKSELPVIDTETVSAALQNTSAFDNLVTQNLTNRGIYDANNQLQLIKKSEITTDFLANKLDSKYAPADDVSQLKTKVSVLQDGDENTTGSIAYKLKNSGLATELQLEIDELALKQTQIENTLPTTVQTEIKTTDLTQNTSFNETVSNLQDSFSEIRSTTQGLSTSLTSIQQITDNYTESLNSDIDNRLKVRGILDANNEVTFAKKIDIEPDVLAQNIVANDNAVSTLSGKIGSNTTEVNNIVTTKLKEKGILNTEENLQVATKEELANLDSKFALKGEVGTDENTVKELISKDLQDRNIIDKNNNALKLASIDTVTALQSTVEKLDGTDEVTGSIAYKLKNAGFAKYDDITSMRDKLLNGDENAPDSIAYKLKTANVITDNNFDAKISAKNLATKADLPVVDEETVNAALANSTTLGTMIDTAVSNKGYLTSSDINSLAKKSDLEGFLKDSDLTAEKLSGKLGDTYLTDNDLTKSKLSDKLSGLYASADSVSTENLTNKLGGTFAKTTDIFENGKLISAKLPSDVITNSNFNNIMATKKLATTDDLPVVDETTINDALSKSTTLSGIIDNAVTSKGFLTTSTLPSDIVRTSTLTDYAKTSDIFDSNNKLIAGKLPSGVITTGNINDNLPDTLVRTSALADYAKTSDIFDSDNKLIAGKLPSGVITTGNINDNLPNTIVRTSTLTDYAKTSDILDNNGVLKTTTIPGNLITSDTLTTQLSGYATTGTVSDLTTRTASLETNALTADNLSAKLSAENSAVKQALSNAGFAKTSEVATTINNTLNGTGEGSFAARLSAAGAITTGNIASNLPSNVVTTTDGKIAASALPDTVVKTSDILDDNNKLKLALPDTVVTTSNMTTTLGNTFAAKSSITDLTSRTASLETAAAKAITTDNLNNDTVKSALTTAGFAKTSDINAQVNSQALTMSDLANILSQDILMVKSDGTLGINPNKTSSGVGTKLSRVGNISSMTASTSIATSVAAATSAAVAADDINDATKCNSTDYMFWDINNSKCFKCPDGTKFIGGTARCQCTDPMKEFSVAGGICNEVSADQAQCIQKENMYWNTKDDKCTECPSDSYYKESTCMCQTENMMLNTFNGKCLECPPESKYNPETRTCTCTNGNPIDHASWATKPTEACVVK